MLITPRKLFGKLAAAIGLSKKAIPVPGQHEFNDEFALQSDDAEQATEAISIDLVEILRRERSLSVEVSSSNLLAYWTNTYIRPAELEERVSTVVEVSRLLKRSR
jgi:hypothetical protein